MNPQIPSHSLDKEGFLKDHNEWTPEIANALARNENILLGAEHWEIINALREFYAQYELSPAMRPLCKYLKLQLGPEKATSLYLLGLFPGSPAKLAAKIAGLPRPENCM